MMIMHEGSVLYVPRKDGSKFVLLPDVDLNEACEYLLDSEKVQADLRGLPKPIASPVVRKVAYPRIPGKRQPSQTGWPKV